MDNLERRYSPVETEDGRKIRGYAMVFNVLSVDLGGFREVIAPEAVDRTLSAGADVRAFAHHDQSKVIGRTRSGTLRLRKDSRGLAVEIEPDLEVSYVKDLMFNIKRGDISGMSFGFRVIEESWDYDGTMPIRTVTDMAFHEVSIVAMPAYTQTDVQVAQRSLQAFQNAQPGNRILWRERWQRNRLAR